ncbi:MAG: glycoside hydrolase family 92 protein [Clostridiales bacterium]|nr:glycoside hydrolase family 92 protein [Clostridiales bacterium]
MIWEISKKLQHLILTLTLIVSSLLPASLPPSGEMPDTLPGEYGQWVDPFIGTGGIPWACAMLTPAATTPFGSVKLGPDTTLPGGVSLFSCGNSGYYYTHNFTFGFSHTRLYGTGAKDMGHFRVTPSAGGSSPVNRLKTPLAFSHSDEVATAGYYAVKLPTESCLAELTATTHVGVHRYTFSTSRDAHIFIDATSFLTGGKAFDGSVKILPGTNEVEGYGTVDTQFAGRYGGLKAYFVAQFNTPFESYATWDADGNLPDRAEASGDDTGADLNFGNINGKPVELKLAISFVSVENARENLEAEAGQLSFESIRTLARSSWDSWLSRATIETSDEDIKTIFYTALYHSMIMPSNFTDVNGEYLGFSGQIGKAEGFTYRTDMSLWDTFRTEHPLLTLVAPEIQLDCIKSLICMAEIGGNLPRWPAGGGYTGSMFGSPADMVISEAYLKGITDFDAEKAFTFMKKTATQTAEPQSDGRDNIEDYIKYGYCPADTSKISVSRTLEYAWADNSIALFAQALGKSEDAEYFSHRALSYKNLYNSETKYFQARSSDGSWVEPFSPDVTSYYDEILPVKYAKGYCEGSAAHWRWGVPQDAQGLISLFPSKKYFVSQLEEFMANASESMAALDPGPGYWQGNQHDIHAPYLFNEAGRPELTQKWVRWILTERHSTEVDGLDGNDDGGTLSSWYVFSSLGLYPVAGTDRYWIGAPIVDKATINLGGSKVLTVIAENQSPENMYVQSVTLNGVRLESPELLHSQIANGATLVFIMGSTPAENGGFLTAA